MVFINFFKLNEILAASNLEPAALSVVTRKLEDVLDAKNGAIKDLQVNFSRYRCVILVT